jgi:dihydrofolate synthase/folylpolyglutamate synthase
MISTFEEALSYLFSHIPKTEMRKFPGELGLARIQHVMKELGDPQETYKVIHIAGTSGKGSTASLISSGLVGQGFKVGLQMSPHLLDIRERVQINNVFISKEKFVQYLNEIIPSIEKVSLSSDGTVTYFEILVALAYYSFWKEKVDYAVIETGMGGLYDGTNVIQNADKIAVVTKIGLDHVSVLGNTVEEIAEQKAGIIHRGNTVVVSDQVKSVKEIISKHAVRNNAELLQLLDSDRVVVSVTESGTEYLDKKRGENVQLSLIGNHQSENAQLAREILYLTAEKHAWELNKDMLQKSFQSVKIPGRVDIVRYSQSTLVIDGAHNVQKMEAFLQTLSDLYPDEKHIFLLAFKHGKDIESMIHMIEPYASEILLTSFWVDTQDMLNISEPVENIQPYIKNVPVSVFSDLNLALEKVRELNTRIIVTGSLYFSSEVYNLLKAKS